eukprot:536373-Rhodomonas_salina.3
MLSPPSSPGPRARQRRLEGQESSCFNCLGGGSGRRARLRAAKGSGPDMDETSEHLHRDGDHDTLPALPPRTKPNSEMGEEDGMRDSVMSVDFRVAADLPGAGAGSWYTPRSVARNRTFSTSCTRNAVSGI